MVFKNKNMHQIAFLELVNKVKPQIVPIQSAQIQQDIIVPLEMAQIPTMMIISHLGLLELPICGLSGPTGLNML